MTDRFAQRNRLAELTRELPAGPARDQATTALQAFDLAKEFGDERALAAAGDQCAELSAALERGTWDLELDVPKWVGLWDPPARWRWKVRYTDCTRDQAIHRAWQVNPAAEVVSCERVRDNAK